MHKKILSVCAAAALVFGAPAAAVAVDSSAPSADTSDDVGGYTPDKPIDPSLAGSSIAVDCIDEVPWIAYAIELTDPEGASASNVARLVFSDEAHSATITLGTLNEGRLSGRVLWPGASVDGAGRANGWPGWEYADGVWRATDGNFAWTRGDVTAKIVVDSEITLPLSYPATTSGCAPVTGQVAASADQGGAAPGLAATGGEIAVTVGVGVAAIGLVAAGTVLVLRRRKA